MRTGVASNPDKCPGSQSNGRSICATRGTDSGLIEAFHGKVKIVIATNHRVRRPA